MIVSGNLAKNQRYYLVGVILSLILETAANFVFGIGQLFISSFTNIRRFCGCGTGQSASRPVFYRFVRTNLWRNNGQRNAPVPHLCLYKKSANLCLFMDCLAKKVLGGSFAQIALLLSFPKNCE